MPGLPEKEVEERPILFTGPMVRAILDGEKRQTRRAVLWKDKPMTPNFRRAWVDPGGTIFGPGPYLKVPCLHPEDRPDDERVLRVRCPYGYPPARLWVREAAKLRAIGTGPKGRIEWFDLNYRADEPMLGSPAEFRRESCGPYTATRWTPGIHMPRWASRITLMIVAVRLQRLQEISHEDAVAEGIPNLPGAQAEYRRLWDSINGRKKGRAWKDNPWVWALTFKVALIKT